MVRITESKTEAGRTVKIMLPESRWGLGGMGVCLPDLMILSLEK